MRTRNRSIFTTIHSEGALLPADLLQRISENDPALPGLAPVSYHLAPNEKLNEAINRSWNRMSALWRAFAAMRADLPADDPGTTPTRERWLLPLFQELGFGRLPAAKAVQLTGKPYPISHHWQQVPIHLVGCGLSLDRRTPGAAGAARVSPHSLLQEYLNRAPEALWGLLSNGLALRLLRDNASLTRQAYLDFDLAGMFEGEVYADFVLLWLVCHQSRFEAAPGLGEDGLDSAECILERWSQAARESGTRALDDLRSGVEQAIQLLGQGFLRQRENQRLQERLRSRQLSARGYYRQLLRLVYRLIFLFTAEERDLLLLPDAPAAARARYEQHFSTARLRALAERQRGTRHHDRYEALKLVLRLLGSADGCPGLALPALGGLLFSPQAAPDLDDCVLDNRALLDAVRALAFIREGRTRRAVDYRSLGSEELGSVYESLLELHPQFNLADGAFQLVAAAGSERKTTGSHYTRPDLVNELIASALDPIIENALDKAKRLAQGEWQLVDGEWSLVNVKWKDEGEKRDAYSILSGFTHLTTRDDAHHHPGQTNADPAPQPGQTLNAAVKAWNSLSQARRRSLLAEHCLLSLTVCDPACGSGHFLVAAAHRIAARLAQVRADGGEPSPNEMRAALRDVIRSCLYGVDINPMAVELCRINLWLESLQPGKPLSFLDAHILCGDSLLGAGPGADFSHIPDEAFTPVFGDHKTTANYLKRRNRQERTGAMTLLPTVYIGTPDGDGSDLSLEQARVNALPEDTLQQAQAKQVEYERLLASQRYEIQRDASDLWAAAFFWSIEEQPGQADVFAPTQAILTQFLNGQPVPREILEQARQIATQQRFFHWELAFPHIFAHLVEKPDQKRDGFDCLLGNPPWERIKLQEQEFFAVRDPEIAAASNKASRQRLIDQLQNTNPALYDAFMRAKHAAECASKFVRQSGRYPLTAVGDVNTYALFAELARSLINTQGRVGIILPTGIATDDSTKDFFADVNEKRAVASLYDFENREALFPGSHRSYKFCLLTLSSQPVAAPQYAFFATRVEHLRDPRRRFTLTPEDIALLNPNTRTLPVFRTRQDAELTRAIYQRVPVLVNEQTGDNPWGVRFLRMFDMSNDSHLFATEPREGYVRLYEAKMFWHYDHRWGTFEGGDTRELSLAEKQDPNIISRPQYWINKSEIDTKVGEYKFNWFLCFRGITNVTNERSLVSAIVPISGIGNSAPIFVFENPNSILLSCLYGNICSLIFDFPVRFKIGGVNLNFFIIKQFPVYDPNKYYGCDFDFIVPRVFELTYTAFDIEPYANYLFSEASPKLRDILVDLWEQNAAVTADGHRHAQRPDWAGPLQENGFPYPPFKWDEARRAVLRAELDAYYARLYGLNRKQLRYMLDPADLTPHELEDILDPMEEVADPLDPAGYDARRAASDFPGETFRVLKDKELRQFGEYRTRRLVLEAWEKLKDEEIGVSDVGTR